MTPHVPEAQFTPPTRYTRTECDIGDLLGTPGIRSSEELVSELGSVLGGTWNSRGVDGGLFIVGRPEGAESGSAGGFGPAGAFAPAGAFGPAGGTSDARAAMRRPGPTLRDVVLAHGPLAGAEEAVTGTMSVTGRHQVFQQVVRGAPVAGAVYGVHEGPGGRWSLTGRPLGDLASRDPGPAPSAGREEVEGAMRRALDVPDEARIQVEQVVFPMEGRAIWAYKGECTIPDPAADVRIFIRADDWSLLLSYDVACSAVLGEGRVYPVNPARSPDPVAVLLHELGPDTHQYLRGTVLDVRPGHADPVTNAFGDYRTDPTEPTFNEVSAYYHARRALRWFVEVLGPDLLRQRPFTPLSVVTDDRSVSAAQVALYMPAQDAIRFARGDRNGARSADIVLHEVAHAVVDRVCRLTRTPSIQSKALSEGFADYAAASALDDPRFGDYVRDVPTGARNCSDPSLRFPAGFAGPEEPYSSGSAWAAVLWDLRRAVGPEVADAVVFHSLAYLAPGSGFHEAVSGLLEADSALFDTGVGTEGRHADSINAAFAGRLP